MSLAATQRPSDAANPNAVSKRVVVAVRGAKGGVGTSVVAANMALYVASLGRKAIVVDADPRGADLHTWLGMTPPVQQRLDCRPIDEVTSTPIDGLSLWHAGVSEPHRGAARKISTSKLGAKFRRLDAEYVIADLGAGVENASVDLWNEADRRLVVVTPELTAIEAAHRLARTSFIRSARRCLDGRDERDVFDCAIDVLAGLPAPRDLWNHLAASSPSIAAKVRAHAEEFEFPFVVNKAQMRTDFQLGDWLCVAMRHRMGIAPRYMGYIEHDEIVESCMHKLRPLMVESPGSKAARTLEKVIRRLLASDGMGGQRRSLHRVLTDSHYDILEVDRRSSDEEVRRAHRRMAAIYASASPALYGLLEDEGRQQMQARVDKAFDVLLDPLRRAPYEQQVFPEVEQEVVEPDPEALRESLPPAPDITASTEFDGSLLRAVRESKGVRLQDVSKRTKVGLHFLESIEAEAFAQLPPSVYVRGFVSEIAKMLELDPEQVSLSYLRKYSEFVENQTKL